MKLLRLKLEHWRGVSEQEIHLDEGVTVIEGPNEIGKSSLFEALMLLFRELDSTSKTHIKAVQPVGEDVGSTVEAEIRTGPYHFTYRKTFNRQKATSLEIHAPQPESLTGRDAHDKAAMIVDETIDVDLWHALQITQGTEVAQALLQDSQGLSKALDAAAGKGAGDEDTDLVTRVLSEYERYFTPKSGKSRTESEESHLEALKAKVDEIKQALDSVDSDLVQHERLQTEQARLTVEVPNKKTELENLSHQLQSINILEGQRDKSQAQRGEVKARLKRYLDDQSRRDRMKLDIQKATQEVEAGQNQLKMHKLSVEAQRNKNESAKRDVTAADQSLASARKFAQAAEQSMNRARDREKLQFLRQKIRDLDAIQSDLAKAKRLRADAGITEKQFKQLEQADGEWRHAKAMLEAGAPEVRVVATGESLRIGICGEQPFLLASGEETVQTAAEVLEIDIDQRARVEVRPGTSLSELKQSFETAASDREGLLAEYGFTNLAQATAAVEKAKRAEKDLHVGKAQQNGLLSGISEDVLREQGMNLEARMFAHADEELLDEDEAISAYQIARQRLTEAQTEREQVGDHGTYEQAELVRLEAELGSMITVLLAAEKNRDSLVSEQKSAHAEQSDDALSKEISDLKSVFDAHCETLEKLIESLNALDPERLRLLHENSEEAWKRMEQKLREITHELDTLSGRLEQSQAQGLYEQLNQAEIAYTAQTTKVDGLRKRAAAVKRLWDTLSRHRDAARKAYLAPFKDQIDNLGRLVFDASFGIELDDELTILSRSLGGKRIMYKDLSVGAKEQVGILARLAAARLVSTQGGVPLILDDTLGYADPERLGTMGAALALAGRDSQIIILTCTPGRFEHIGTARIVQLSESAKTVRSD